LINQLDSYKTHKKPMKNNMKRASRRGFSEPRA